jgi:hypothetical protein
MRVAQAWNATCAFLPCTRSATTIRPGHAIESGKLSSSHPTTGSSLPSCSRSHRIRIHPSPIRIHRSRSRSRNLRNGTLGNRTLGNRIRGSRIR